MSKYIGWCLNKAVIISLVLFSKFSFASLITLEFNSFTSPAFVQEPYEESGFLLTPNCHYDAGIPGYAGHDSNWIGFDLSGCLDAIGPEAILRLTKVSGGLFDIVSLFAVTSAFDIRSSKGGVVNAFDAIVGSFDGEVFTDRTVYFEGALWTDVEWIDFSTSGGVPEGIDNIVLRTAQINEPAMTHLIFLFFILLVFIRTFPAKP